MMGLLLASNHWQGHDGGWFPWFPLIPLFFFAVIVVLFLTVGRRRWARVHGAPGESVLAERYARGEIDQAEYQERRSVLRQKD